MTTFERLFSVMDAALGLGAEPRELSVLQTSLRAVIIFVAATIMVRVGSRRFIGRSTALDVMLGIIFGSVVSRAIVTPPLQSTA